jgi:hypothetical protein
MSCPRVNLLASLIRVTIAAKARRHGGHPEVLQQVSHWLLPWSHHLGEEPQSCVIFFEDKEIEWSCYIWQP